jgi:hypothetical protein
LQLPVLSYSILDLKRKFKVSLQCGRCCISVWPQALFEQVKEKKNFLKFIARHVILLNNQRWKLSMDDQKVTIQGPFMPSPTSPIVFFLDNKVSLSEVEYNEQRGPKVKVPILCSGDLTFSSRFV